MTKDEVMAMSDERLCIEAETLLGYSVVRGKDGLMAWIPGNPLTARPVRSFTDDITAAWELFKQARNGDQFWDFCTALKDLAVGDDSVPAWKNYMVILGYLGPGIITRAFIMAMEARKEEG